MRVIPGKVCLPEHKLLCADIVKMVGRKERKQNKRKLSVEVREEEIRGEF